MERGDERENAGVGRGDEEAKYKATTSGEVIAFILGRERINKSVPWNLI